MEWREGRPIFFFLLLDLVAMCWGKALWGTVEPHCLNYAKNNKNKNKKQLALYQWEGRPSLRLLGNPHSL